MSHSITAPTTTSPIIAIRTATEHDATEISRLSELDSKHGVPAGELLVGVVNGEIRAALPLDGGPVIANPFHPTAELVTHLEIRAARVRDCRAGKAEHRPARRSRSRVLVRT